MELLNDNDLLCVAGGEDRSKAAEGLGESIGWLIGLVKKTCEVVSNSLSGNIAGTCTDNPYYKGGVA